MYNGIPTKCRVQHEACFFHSSLMSKIQCFVDTPFSYHTVTRLKHCVFLVACGPIRPYGARHVKGEICLYTDPKHAQYVNPIPDSGEPDSWWRSYELIRIIRPSIWRRANEYGSKPVSVHFSKPFFDRRSVYFTIRRFQ